MASSALQQSVRAIIWNFASIGVGFINGVLTARILLPEGRGVLAVALTLGSISALAAGMGTNVALRALMPRGEAGLRNYLRITLWLLPTIVLLGGIVAYWSLRDSEGTAPPVVTYVAILLLCVCSFLGTQAFDVLNAAGRNSVSARANMLGNGMVAALLVIPFSLGGSVREVAVCYLIAYILRQCLLTLEIVRIKKQLPADISGSERKLLHMGVRFMGLNVGQAFTFRVDLIFIELFRGAATAGIYTVAATPAAILQVLSSTIGQVVFRHVADGSFGRRQVVKYAAGAFVITSLGAILIFLLADPLIPFVFGAEYSAAVPILKLLVVAEVCLSPYLVMSRAAAGLRMTRVASGSGIFGVLMMGASLLVLVPAFGAWGAAFACTATYAAMSMFVGIPVIRSLHPGR